MSGELEDPEDSEDSESDEGSTDFIVVRHGQSNVIRHDSNEVYHWHDWSHELPPGAGERNRKLSSKGRGLVSPVRGRVQPEEILHCEDHDTGRVQTEERYFVLVATRQHLQQSNIRSPDYNIVSPLPRKLNLYNADKRWQFLEPMLCKLVHFLIKLGILVKFGQFFLSKLKDWKIVMRSKSKTHLIPARYLPTWNCLKHIGHHWDRNKKPSDVIEN